MTLPLPDAPDYDGAHLRHLLPSACAAMGLDGFSNSLGLPEASITMVVMVDGLGDENLAAHTGHARFLSSAWRSASAARVLECGAPATTAVSLSSFGTGTTVGQHGLTGYDVYSPQLDRVVNMLSGWDDDVDPLAWQPHPSLLAGAAEAGAKVVTISRAQFRDSGLTRASLSGGEFLGADRIEQRFAAAADWIAAARGSAGHVRQGPPTPLLVYLYVDELDKQGHKAGVASQGWRNMLESLDAAAKQFCTRLRERYGDQASVLLTADHGMLDIPAGNRIDLTDRPELLEGVAATAGDPRMLYLHAEAGQDADQLAERFRAAFGDIAWVLTRDSAVLEGWFGPVEEHALGRIGDVIVALHQPWAIVHTGRTGKDVADMVGMHGSLTEVERRVPLLELTGRALMPEPQG